MFSLQILKTIRVTCTGEGIRLTGKQMLAY